MSSPENTSAKTFGVVTAFAMKAKRKGSMPRQQALRNAQKLITNLAADYQKWFETDMTALRQIVSEGLEATNAQDPSASHSVDRAHRKATQIREVGSTFDYELITRVAGSLCELLLHLNKIDGQSERIITCHLQALTLVSDTKYQGMKAPDVPDLLDGLRKMVVSYSESYGDESILLD